ncbi:hypothetical protein ABIB25_005114 [Nakamurella sp. UYEF19]|uniref:Pr6Pr family membrane protein n=1 Tax=Nakamurella sp. UYEF19 TaxID=1756392 RepID=UPI00339731AB
MTDHPHGPVPPRPYGPPATAPGWRPQGGYGQGVYPQRPAGPPQPAGVPGWAPQQAGVPGWAPQPASWQQPPMSRAGYAPPMMPQPGPQPGPQPSSGQVAFTVIWKLAVSAIAFTGLFLAHDAFGSWHLEELSQLGSLIAGVYFLLAAIIPLARRRHLDEPDPFVRMSVLLLVLVTLGVYNLVMAGQLDKSWSKFEHIFTPLALLVDWFAVGRNQETVKWWHVIAAPAAPLAYLVFAVMKGNADGSPIYSILDTSDSGFFPFVIGALIGIWVVALLLMGIGRLHRSMRLAPPPVAGGSR